MSGNPVAGKIVGVTGAIGVGALAGAIGGPIGAGIGAGVGAAVWGLGELIGAIFWWLYVKFNF